MLLLLIFVYGYLSLTASFSLCWLFFFFFERSVASVRSHPELSIKRKTHKSSFFIFVLFFSNGVLFFFFFYVCVCASFREALGFSPSNSNNKRMVNT